MARAAKSNGKSRPAALGRTARTTRPKARKRKTNGRAEIDPITFSVILNRFNTIANEMTLVMERTAWTSIIALSHDFSCAIYDRKDRQVCMMDALPIHTNSMHVVLKEIARVFDGDIHDGDVIVCNDPYSGNTHVGDFVTACPVFYKGEHLFWSVTKGHQLDCGAFMPTSVPAAAKGRVAGGAAAPADQVLQEGQALRGHHPHVPRQRALEGLALRGPHGAARVHLDRPAAHPRNAGALRQGRARGLHRRDLRVFGPAHGGRNPCHARRRISRRCVARHRRPGRHEHPDSRQSHDQGRQGARGFHRLRAADARLQQQHPGRDAGGGWNPDHVHDRPHHSAQ